MPHPTGPTSDKTRKIIAELRKSHEKDAMKIADELEKPARSKSSVNLSKISKTKTEAVAVPGKVLGAGELTKPISIYALSFSKSARDKITKAKGKALLLNAIVKDKTKAKMMK